jgi:hypothetical protein
MCKEKRVIVNRMREERKRGWERRKIQKKIDLPVSNPVRDNTWDDIVKALDRDHLFRSALARLYL